jgi:hypothetical protein
MLKKDVEEEEEEEKEQEEVKTVEQYDTYQDITESNRQIVYLFEFLCFVFLDSCCRS